MGSSSQAIRYPVATTSARNIDALNRVLADLCTRSNPKDGAALTLRWLVEEEAHDLSGEAFARFMDHIYELITTFIDRNEVSENLGALRAIDELIDVTISENASKVAKFSNYMSAAFETKRDPEILVLVSEVLGHLDRSGGAMTADEVEHQVKVVLEWLHGERIEYRRFSAILILKEIAENASTVFNVYVSEFVDAIWVTLRDPTLVVREKAIEELCTCLRVIEELETRWSFSEPQTETSMEHHSTIQLGIVHLLPKVEILVTRSSQNVALRDPMLVVQKKSIEALHACLRVMEKRETRYYRMFEATEDGLGRNAPVHSIHGSLLAIGELQRFYLQEVEALNIGEFMMSRYRKVAEIVLRYLEHRDRLVCLSITSLLPRIAHFLRD
ncbi:Serine/threonine-protein kinase TOR [Capsicum baccatum]|uniref:Serine/threonine-protein kinase TOR n=1 Tax=Capsicum baccatum TaxID=33114 RepID=A0A2G2V5D5_CAPBA|nr:Serine/threonine-protein kinase TOR [Capsicum baccatum]